MVRHSLSLSFRSYLLGHKTPLQEPFLPTDAHVQAAPDSFGLFNRIWLPQVFAPLNGNWSLSPLTLCLVSALIGVGCDTALPLRVENPPIMTKLSRSAIVVLGTVTSTKILGSTRMTPEGLHVRTWSVSVDVAHVFKSDVSLEHKISFFVNGYDPAFVHNGDFERFKPGDKRVFLLVRNRKRLRAVVDFYRTSIPFQRNSDNAFRSGQMEPVGAAIARALLHRPAAESGQKFAESVPALTTQALRTGGYSFVASLLDGLRKDGDSAIRTEACLTEYEQLFGDEGCVNDLAKVQPGPASQRLVNARERRAYLRRIAAEALEQHLPSPLTLYCSGVEPDDPESILEFFRFLSRRRDAVFRKSAERELLRIVQ